MIQDVPDDYPISIVFTFQELRLSRMCLSTFLESIQRNGLQNDATKQIKDLIEKLDKIATLVKNTPREVLL